MSHLNTTKLTVKELLAEKEGEFVCSASNNRGTSSLSFRLYKDEITNEFQFYLRSLISSPVVKIDEETTNLDMLVFDYSLIEENKSEVKPLNEANSNLTSDLVIAKVSQPLLLRCPHNEVSRDTDVKWFKSGKKLSDLSVNRFGHLYLKMVTNEDFGLYSCKAQKQTFNINLEKLGEESLNKHKFLGFNNIIFKHI